MSAKEKAHIGGNHVGLEKQRQCHYKPILPRIKAFIMKLATWGLIPPPLASWLIRKRGLQNA